MSLDSIARRYARALFDLALEENSLDRTTNEVRSVGETVAQSPELTNVLADPTVALESRKAIMGEVAKRLGVSPTVRNAVQLITDHGRAALFPRIANALGELADERAGRVKAHVTSATQLSEAQYNRLAAALEKITGRKISLERKVDPTLIGGVVARVGDIVYDGSVRNRLSELRRSLLPS